MIISNNKIYDNRGQGIDAYGYDSPGITIISNEITNNSEGIYIHELAFNQIIGNSLINNREMGIYLESSPKKIPSSRVADKIDDSLWMSVKFLAVWFAMI